MTKRLRPDPSGLAEAGALLRAGGLVAFPTETVYGLGADATQGRAVAGIYDAKGRPKFNPLIAHVARREDAEALAYFSPLASKFADQFWPGPLTLVLPKRESCPVSDLALAGLESIAIRVPSSETARRIIEAAGRPIAAPSANRSGHVSPTSASHVLADLDGRIDAVVMGENAMVGVESTILSLLDDVPRLLRPGGVTRDMITAVLGDVQLLDAASSEESQPLAPGMLQSHYAPDAAVRLDAETVELGEAALLFGSKMPAGLEGAKAVINLSAKGDLAEAASALFGALRALDRSGATTIAVSPIPAEGLGEAIRDRLQRAAAPRP